MEHIICNVQTLYCLCVRNLKKKGINQIKSNNDADYMGNDRTIYSGLDENTFHGSRYIHVILHFLSLQVERILSLPVNNMYREHQFVHMKKCKLIIGRKCKPIFDFI